MARWMIGAGIGVLVAGMIMIGLGLYFGFSAFVLLLYGGLISAAGLVLLGVGGELRSVGALLLAVGIVGTVVSVLQGSLAGGFRGMSNLPGYLLFYGILWGPVMITIGLASILGARRSRGSPLTS